MKISSLNKGLIGHWKLNGNAKDNTPYNNNGTVVGATLTTDRYNSSNKSYSFDGINNYIEITRIISIKSISFWIKVSSIPIDSRIIFIHQPSHTACGFYQGNSLILTSGSLADTKRTCDLTNFNINAWNHISITYDASNTPSIKINNTIPNYISNNYWTEVTTNSLLVGKRSTGGNLLGNIDDMRIYNRILTATEISQLYNTYGGDYIC